MNIEYNFNAGHNALLDKMPPGQKKKRHLTGKTLHTNLLINGCCNSLISFDVLCVYWFATVLCVDILSILCLLCLIDVYYVYYAYYVYI